jgi:glycerophosphoryl diester phosphodiesterase
MQSAPECTLAGFRACAALRVGFEFDVRRTKDGALVCLHDATVDRTTPGRGSVASLTAGELGRLNVPSLADVLTRFRDTRVVIELKVNSKQLGRAVVDVVRKAGAIERVCLGSFGLRVLHAARGLEPAIATSAAREEVRWALYRSWIRRPTHGAGYTGFQVPEFSGRTRVVSRRFVDLAHSAGLGVHVWTVDTEDDARRLLGWGVDGLITDRPDVIVPVAREARMVR